MYSFFNQLYDERDDIEMLMNGCSWFNNVSELPEVLTKEECYSLMERMKNGDVKARESLIVHNIRLVLHQVNHRFSNIDYDKGDLVSNGIIGLIKAIDNFDTSKNFQFATYAIKCIDNEILMFLRKVGRDLKISSIDSIIWVDDMGNELRIEDIISDDVDMVEDYETNETYQIIRDIINELNERDREIIVLYFGFFGNRRFSQQDIAEKFNLSQPHISRVISKIIKKIEYRLEELDVFEMNNRSRNNKRLVKKLTIKNNNM